MNRLILIPAIVLACTFQVFSQDETLIKEIQEWKKGSRAPARLLKFPDGDLTPPLTCGIPAIGDSVVDYIGEINNPELLKAIILDGSAQADSFRAAVGQFIRLTGVGNLARLLVDNDKPEPSPFRDSEFAILAQLLRSPYVALKVAEVSMDDMVLEKAQRVLAEMKLELEDGKDWASVYRKHANRNPDRRDPDGIRTLICFRYDGVVAPTGFDILSYSVQQYVPPLDHLRTLCRQKEGTHIVKGPDRVYLYHIEGYFGGITED